MRIGQEEAMLSTENMLEKLMDLITNMAITMCSKCKLLWSALSQIVCTVNVQYLKLNQHTQFCDYPYLVRPVVTGSVQVGVQISQIGCHFTKQHIPVKN